MQSVSSLRWLEQATDNEPLAKVSVDFGLDNDWSVSLLGEYFFRPIMPAAVSIDNSGQDENIVVTLGQAQYSISPYKLQTINIAPGTLSMSLTGSGGVVPLTFWINNRNPNADGSNDYAIQQASERIRAELNMSGFGPVINPSMAIWPEGDSFNSAAAPVYGPEGWMIHRANNKTGATLSRQGGISGNIYTARTQKAVSDTNLDEIYFATQLETFDSAQFQGKDIVLSFDALKGADFSAVDNKLTVSVVYGTGTDENVLLGFTGQTTAGTEQFEITSVNQRLSLGPVAIPISAKQIGLLFYYKPTANGGANDWFEINNAQIDEGESTYSFRHIPYAIEEDRCLRYFENLTPGVTGNNKIFVGLSVGTACFIFAPYALKRDAPTIDFSSVSTFNVYTSGDNTNAVTSFSSVVALRGGTTFNANVSASAAHPYAACYLSGSNSGTPFIKVNARM